MNAKVFDQNNLSIKKLVNLKYLGTSEPTMVKFASWNEMKKEFQKKFQNQFGFTESSKEVVISSILMEMIYRGEKIDSFPQSKTIDNSVSKANDFQKVFDNMPFHNFEDN